MMRVQHKTVRTNSLASIWIKTMKTTTTLTLAASLLFAVSASTTVKADGFYSSKHGSAPRRTTTEMVDCGKFTWLSPDSSVNRIVVSLADQSLYAYEGQTLVAYSNISSGRAGHETPTGSFTVSEKDADHHSSLYEDASMPFFMRLTDDGVGLHAGFIPGYPASHGCVRLPLGMARELYQHVESGTPVQIISSSVTTVAQSPVAPAVHLAQN
jgi:lipoprotein-anchoring transpeptidase ErfK/SrfK